MNNSGTRPVIIWLLCGCFMIFCMVVIGGITRLTGSGLSITEWKPIMGTLPPLNEADWQIAFQKYKEIPQFQKINYDFNLSDFKSIFWWEYIHRLFGRLIGIVFIVPFIWFFAKGRFEKSTLRKVLFLFLLGGLQGFLGWFMVKSGLAERTSVSHIRLAIHLITAFITFGFTLYFALELADKSKPMYSSRLNKLVKTLFFFVIIQIIYGAFVAGMHAGKIYNTFPLMNGKLIPDGVVNMSPAWLNFFENQGTVQFMHRTFAYLIVLLTITLFVLASKVQVDSKQSLAIRILLVAVSVQFLLGVFTLLTGVNFLLAIIHQAAAFFLFSAMVYLVFIFRKTHRSGMEIREA